MVAATETAGAGPSSERQLHRGRAVAITTPQS